MKFSWKDQDIKCLCWNVSINLKIQERISDDILFTVTSSD